MSTRGYAAASALLALYIGGVAIYAGRHPSHATLVAHGSQLYAIHCASCHGVRLEGQPEWRRAGADGRLPAPPHDESGHTWHHPDHYLIHVVEQGLVPGVDRPPDYQSNMPAFGKTLSHEDVIAILSFIKSRWSYDYRAWQERANTAVPTGEPKDTR